MKKLRSIRKRRALGVQPKPVKSTIPRVCRNCGGRGQHFVPPCFGDLGFFICEEKV